MNLFKKLAATAALAIGLLAAPMSANAEEVTEETTVIEETAVDEVAEPTFTFDFSNVDVTETPAEPVVEAIEPVEETVETVIEPAAETPAEPVIPTVETAVEAEEPVVVAETPVVPVVEESVEPAVEPVVEPTVEETVPTIEPAAAIADVAVVEEVTETEEKVAGDVIVPAVADETPETPEPITGELIGSANRGYAEMSDGADAYCVQEEYEHVDADATYEKVNTVSDVNFDSVFVAIAEADEAGADQQTTRQIAQLAIWSILNPSGIYRDSVSFHFGETGVALFDRMINGATDEWNVNTWGYVPTTVRKDGRYYQALISGTATKNVLPDIPEIPETPEEPDVPEIPEIPETPEEPVVPDVPDVPVIPETPVTPPSTPSVPETPVQVQSVEWENPTPAPVVDVLPAQWEAPQTGDNATMIYIFAALFVFGCALTAYGTKKTF